MPSTESSAAASPGQRWAAPRPSISRSGEIEFEVRGLVLAGGNSIGTPGAVVSVAGTVVCGPGISAATPQVPLSAHGDAQFEGAVSIPPGCTSENIAFLLTAPNGQWIANGAVRTP